MEIGKWEGIRFIQLSAAAWSAAWSALRARQTAGEITTTLHAPRVRPRRGGRSGTVAAAKRAALKAKRRKAHKRRVR